VRVAELSIAKHFSGIGYQPHPEQVPIHNSAARHRVAACGRRFGKSQIGGHEVSFQPMLTQAVLHTLEGAKRHEIWLVGPEYSDAEKEFRVVWNDIKRMGIDFDKPGSYYNAETGALDISLFKGKLKIHGKSSKYPDTLVGEGLSGVVMCEAAKMKATIWTKYIRPALADFRGWSLWLSTPEGKNHFYEAYQRGLDPAHKTWAAWRKPSWSNPFVFPLGKEDPEIAEMKAEMSEQRAEQEIEASFTDYVGAVFKDFDEEVHVGDLKYRRDLPIYGCCDFGWTNPFVWLAIQVDVFDNVYVLGEYRADHKDVPEIGDELVEWPLAKHCTTLYPDPAEPDSAQILSRKLKCNIVSDTGGEKKWRLHYIRKALKLMPEHLEDGHEDKKPKLFIDRKCVGLIREMQDYRYPDNKSEIRPDKEEPMDKDDHGPEALGRFFRGYYGPVTSDHRRATMQKANMGSGGPIRKRRRTR